MGGLEQAVLGKSGDAVCIDWGYVYLAGDTGSETGNCAADGTKAIYVKNGLNTGDNSSALFLLAYDDVYSVTYFGERLRAYWKKDGQTVEQAMLAAFREYETVRERCRVFNREMVNSAAETGGEKYAKMLQLALRQVLAAHKLALDTEGNILYISKECLSNGCAATADISYPSVPLFLL
jgi:hypothetical protein